MEAKRIIIELNLNFVSIASAQIEGLLWNELRSFFFVCLFLGWKELWTVGVCYMGIWQSVPEIKVEVIWKVADLTSKTQTLLIVKSVRCLAY